MAARRTRAVDSCNGNQHQPAADGGVVGASNIDLMRFAKGHGTGNDFVILPDPDGELDITPQLVARLCDRHVGIEGDGVLRIVRSAAAEPEADGQAAEWFMDYRNADGSI